MQKRNMFCLLFSVLLVANVSAGTDKKSCECTECALVAADELNVGYVNSMAVVGESKMGKDTFGAVEAKRQSFTADLQKEDAEIKKEAAAYQEKFSTLSDAAKVKADNDIRKRQRDLENKGKEYEEDFKILMRQSQENVYRDFSDAVYETARAAGHDIVVDVASGRVFVINPDKVSGTNSAVVKAMDKNYEVKLAKAKKEGAKVTA